MKPFHLLRRQAQNVTQLGTILSHSCTHMIQAEVVCRVRCTQKDRCGGKRPRRQAYEHARCPSRCWDTLLVSCASKEKHATA